MSNDKKIYSSPQYRNLGIKPGNPDSNFSKIYPKDDGWYILDSAGKETKLNDIVVKAGNGELSTLRIDSCNTADGDYSTVSGGYSNSSTELASTISGGFNNNSSSIYSVIGGGYENKIPKDSPSSSIVGGAYNIAGGTSSFIGGGRINNVYGEFSSSLGGFSNTVRGNCSSSIGGEQNRITGNYSSIIGGSGGISYGAFSNIGNGIDNTVSGDYTSILNGISNTASGCGSSILNGFQNTASGSRSSILNGDCNTASGIFSSVLNGDNNTSSGIGLCGKGYSSVINGENNTASGGYSSVLNGGGNIASGNNSSVLNGDNNTASGNRSSVLNGGGNTATGDCSTVVNGSNNTASGVYSTVVNGTGSTASHDGSTVIGSGMASVCQQTTHMTKIHLNNPDSTTLFSPVLVLDTTDNKMVKTRSMGGLFAQTSTSTDITNTTTETSLISGGTGYLYVPPNGFLIGDSFTARIGGRIKALNNQTLRIRIKTNGTTILADTGVYQFNGNVGQGASIKTWDLSINFTIRSLGAIGVASISSGGVFNHNRDTQNSFEGVAFHTLNVIDFDTTVSNTLEITAEWGSANSANSIFSEYFVLTKIY